MFLGIFNALAPLSGVPTRNDENTSPSSSPEAVLDIKSKNAGSENETS